MSEKDLDPAWTPALGSSVLYTEHTWFAGVFVQAVGYGIIVPLAIQCEVFLYRSLRKGNARRKLAWMVLVFILFGCATVCAVADERLGELSFIYYRNYPGGPSAFELDFNSLPINGIGNVCLVIVDWICTGIQLWRFYVLYSSSIFNVRFILAIPCIAYIATIVLGILWSIQVNQPTSNTFITSQINWTAPYLGLTLALNVVISAALVLRLLFYRCRLGKYDIEALDGGADYLGIATMITESALIYATFSLVSLVLFLVNNPVQNVFDPLFVMTEIIATLLILHRVASGSAWSPRTVEQLFSSNTIIFNGGQKMEKSDQRFEVSGFGDSGTLSSALAQNVEISSTNV